MLRLMLRLMLKQTLGKFRIMLMIFSKAINEIRFVALGTAMDMDIELDTVMRGHIITLSLTARLECYNEILGNIWRLETSVKQNNILADIVKPVISMIPS